MADGWVRARETRRPRFVVAFTLVCAACAHFSGAPAAGNDPNSVVRAAITAANEEFARALVRGDAKAMAAVFAEDGEIIPVARRGFVSGRAAIEAYEVSRLEARRYLDVVITTVQLGVSGDVAWEIGTSRATIQQAQGAPVVVTGRYLAVWRREPDGTWRLRADLPVSDPLE